MATQSWNPTIANNILAAYLRGTGNNITAPAATYMKLHTNANSSAGPGAAGTSNPSTETTRVAVTCSAPSGGVIQNSGAISWASIGVSGTEVIAFFSMWDNLTAGNFLFSGTITPVTVNPTDPVSVPINGLTVSMTVAS